MMSLKIHTSLELLLVVLSVVAVLPASISPDETQEEKVVNTTGLTNLQVTRVRFVWNIKNLYLSDFVNRQEVRSPTFSSGSNDNNYQWYLQLYPKGISKEANSYVALFIHSGSSSVTANISLGFLNSNNEETYKKEFSHALTKNGSRGYVEFIKQDFLVNPENGLLTNGSLTIFCDVKTLSTSSTFYRNSSCSC